MSLGPWLERQWESSLLAGGALGERNLLGVTQARHAAATLLRELDPEAPAAARPALLRLVLQAWELCRHYEISSRELTAAANGADQAFFAEWAARYFERLETRGWVDTASLPALVAEAVAAGDANPPGPICLAGFDRPTPAQRQLIDALLAQDRIAGRLASRDLGTTAASVARDEPDDEYRLAARWARSMLETDADATVGIVIPDLAQKSAHVRRVFLDAFDAGWRGRDGATFPLSLDDGRTLPDCGLVHAALTILRLPDGPMDYRDFGQLLRSPHIEGCETEACERALLDLRLRNRTMQRIDARAVSRQERAPVFAGLLADMFDATSQLGQRREPADWLVLIEDLLRRMGWTRGRVLSVDEDRQLQEWNHALRDFARLGEVAGRVDYARARRLLEDCLRERSVNRVRAGGGVQILAPRDAADHEFDGLWLCGLSSAAWPPVPRPNALVPSALQRERGVPEAEPDHFRADSLGAMRRLIAASGQAIASWSAQDGEQECVPSPILDSCPPLAAGDPILADAGDRLGWIRTDVTLETLTDRPPPLADHEPTRGGSRLLTLQSSCPARAFFELRLGAREMPAPPFAIDALWRGNLTHDALEDLYRALVDAGGPQGLDDSVIQPLLQGALDAALDEHIPPRHPLAETLRRNERARLVRLLAGLIEQDLARPPFAVESLEADHDATVGPLTLRLRLDRVDRLAGDRRVVFDYKTGREQKLSVWRGERPQEPQLPLYAATGDAAGIGFISVQGAEVKISGLGAEDLGLAQLAGTRDFRAGDWERTVAEWRAALESLAREFADGDCRIDPDHDRYSLGDFAMLTRRFELRWSEEGE